MKNRFFKRQVISITFRTCASVGGLIGVMHYRSYIFIACVQGSHNLAIIVYFVEFQNERSAIHGIRVPIRG